MPLLAHMLVVPAVEDGADTVAAGAAAAHNGLPPSVPPTHSSSSIPGPSSAPQSPPVREPSPVKEPTPVRESTPVWEPTPRPVREPTPDSPRPPFSPPRSEEVGPTTSTRSPNPTRHTSVHEDISEGGGDFVSSPQSNEASQTSATTAAGGAEDSAALTALSLKLDRLVLSDSEGEDTTPPEQDIDLEALYTLARTSLGGDSSYTSVGHDAPAVPADATMPFRRRRVRKPFTTSASAHVPDNIPAYADIPAAATTIPAGKAPMVDDSLPADLLFEQECVLKNLHDSQLGEKLAKKIHAEQEAEAADQRRRELDATQLIYTEADWVELLAKIATNSALSKQLLGDDVTEDNMNERLGMLLLRKRQELAEQSRVKPMTKIQQRDYMRDFVKNNSASVYNQGWTIKKRSTFLPKHTLDAPTANRANQGAPQVPAASTQVPADVPAAPSFAADVSVSTATTPVVPAAESRPADTPTASAYVSVKHSVAASTQSSSRRHRKDIAKKWVTPIVDMADAALIKFDSDSGILHMVEKTNLQKLQGAVDNLYQREDSDTFALRLWGDLQVLFQSLDDEDAHDFWRNQDSWRIRSWRLYPRAQVHILETVDGRVIYMFVDVSYPLTVATLERMLKDRLEVPKLLVRGDLTMAEQLIGFIKVAILNAQSAV
nr:aminoacyl-tRNA synthetase, class 1a, anticodon-binding [Tanacetum cinerariifolium]